MSNRDGFSPGFASQDEVAKRKREIQFVLNVIEPDPEYQPLFYSDETRLNACTRNEEDVIVNRLRFYFGAGIEFNVNSTLVDFVDSISRQIPDWLDNED